MSLNFLVRQWSFDPGIVLGVMIAAILYFVGWRSTLRIVSTQQRTQMRWFNACAFYGGLLAVVIALESPIDYLSATLFWAHMLQHLLLIMVAAPLLMLGDPAIPLLRGIPLQLRRRGLGLVVHSRWTHWMGRVVGAIAAPWPAVVLFTLDLYLWHWNRLFDLTLRNGAVHIVEHLCFLGTAVLFWSQIIDQRPMKARISYAWRMVYILGTGVASNLLALYFVFTPKPLYSVYAAVSHRPFGISALADQQLAGALMWVPVLFLFGSAWAVIFFKALGEDDGGVVWERPGETPYSMLPQSAESTAGLVVQYIPTGGVKHDR